MADEPFLNCTYAVEVDGVQIATFREASGLAAEITVVENLENTQSGLPVLTKWPGVAKWSDITLKRSLSTNRSWWEWIKQVQEGKINEARRNASVTLQNTQHEERLRFNIRNAWVSKVSVSGLAADGSEAAVEEATLVHEGLEVTQ